MELIRQAGARLLQKHSLGQVSGIQRLILIILLLNVPLLTMPIFMASTASATPVVKVLAVVLLGLVGWRWTIWLRGGRLIYADLGLEAVAIVLAAVTIGDPMPTLGIIYTAFYYRPLVGTLRSAAVGAVTSVGALFAGAYFASHAAHTVLSAELIGQIPMLAMTAMLGCVLSFTLGRQQRLTNELSDAERQYRSLVEQLPEVVFTCSIEGVMTYMSPQSDEILGHAPDEIVGLTLDDFELHVHPADRGRFQEAKEVAMAELTPFLVEYRLLCPAGKHRWVRAQGRVISGPDGVPSHWLGTISDITERKHLEDQLAFQAFHDNLTGLPNRALLRDRLEHAIARVERSDSLLAVLFLDLDNFKIVNDSLGHQAGDELIQSVAVRLQSVIRSADTVARIGGDEFVILLEDLVDESEAAEVAERVFDALKSELRLKDQPLNVTASIGIAFRHASDADADDLMCHADLAMYAAKQQGRARYAVYSPKMGDEAVERLEVETGLRRALERDELVVHFQPVVDLQTGKISEVEGLVRWNHPERGLLAPGAFIDVAEETGLIRCIDLWVLRESCKQVRAWQLEWPHHADLMASVNLSPSQLREPALRDQVAAILEETGLKPRHLKLEITEHAMVADIQQAREALNHLSELGVKLAIDDFGTGNSALNYLREFPIDTLKIDRSFVTGLAQGRGDREMVQAMITLARSLGLNVTAEGIEGDEYLDLLQFGCDHGQGYHFARPQQASVLEYLVRQPVINLETSAILVESAAG